MPPWVIILIIVAIAIAVSTFNLGNAVPLNTDLTREDYSGLLASLAFIAIVAERVIEVFNSIWRRKNKVLLLQAIEAAKDNDAKEKAQTALNDYRAKTETYAMYGGLAIGAAVAVSGVHILGFLYPDVGILSATQKLLFHATDIVLTAGLIAGGSKAINGVTAVFGNYLDSSAERARNAGKPSGGDAPDAPARYILTWFDNISSALRISTVNRLWMSS